MELINLRDQYSKHYDLGEGKIKAELSLTPIHYEEDGQWKDIDLNIISEKNWEFEYALKTNTFRAYFNDVTDIDNNTLAGFELINNGTSRWINYKLYNAHPTENIYDGNTFKYIDVFPGVDLEYIVTPSRLKENIILKSSNAGNSYTFTFKLDGVTLEQPANGEILFKDIDTGEVIWTIDKPYAIDNAEVITNNVEYTLGTEIYEGIEYQSITVSINDDSFLANAVYPVTIDPTTKTLSPTLDTYYRSYQGSTSIGDNMSSAYIYIGHSDDPSTRYYPLFKFDVSSIPTNATITNAMLNLYQQTQYYTGTTFYLYKVTSAWDSSSTALPAYDTIALASDTSLGKSWHIYPVQDVVSNWVNGGIPNYGFVMYTSGTSGANGYFWSSDYTVDTTLRPYLSVTYIVAPSAPSNVNVQGEVDEIAVITWSPATDNGTAQGELKYNIDLSLDGGSTWKTIVPLSLVGATSYSYNFKDEADTTNAKIRIRAYDTDSLYGGYAYSGMFVISHGKVFVKVNGQYKKVKVYIKINGQYKETKVYRKVSGVYTKV